MLGKLSKPEETFTNYWLGISSQHASKMKTAC